MSDPAGILNWRRLDERVTTSGQPTPDQLGEIARLGARHVINLGMDSHERALPGEASIVARLGMAYTHIPVDFAAPTQADFDAFRTAFEATQADTVHVHCIYNWRVSAFFYKYRRDCLGQDGASARQDMDAIWHPDPIWTAFLEAPG